MLSTVDYRIIASWLRHRIETGELRPGERVPGCAELMKLFDVGKHTARRAINELKSENLITVDPGRGTFARDVQPVVRLVFGDSAPGRRFWPTTQRETRVPPFPPYTWEARASSDVAQALEIRPGSQVRVHRGYLATPRREIQQAITYRPAHLADSIEPVRFRDELRVRLPDSSERNSLELTIATPVVDIARTSYAANGQPLELSRIVMDANAYLLEYHYPVSDGSAARPTSRRSKATP